MFIFFTYKRLNIFDILTSFKWLDNEILGLNISTAYTIHRLNVSLRKVRILMINKYIIKIFPGLTKISRAIPNGGFKFLRQVCSQQTF